MKKHKAFDQEVNANVDAVNSLQQDGEDMIAEGHFASAEITATLATLHSHWADLLAASANKSLRLTHASQLIDFNREVDELSSYISDSITTARSTDVGHNVDRCEHLQKKFEDFANDVTANGVRVDMISEVVKALEEQGHPEVKTLHARREV